MDRPGDNKNLLNVLAIVLIAFCLRLFMLGSQSLWLDEAVIYSQTKAAGIADVYSTVMNQEGHIGPLYHILNYLFCLFFGYSEWALRMPSAIYGTISVLFIYKIAEALWNRNVALLSSILMAFSPLHVWYSQEARMYSLWVMLILITTFLFIKMLEKRGLLLWLVLTTCASLSIWTFLNSIFVFLGLGLYLVMSCNKDKRQWRFFFLSIFVAVATYLPGIAALLAKESIAVGSSRRTSIFDLIYAFYVFNVGTTFGPTLYAIRASLKQVGATTTACRILSDNAITIIPSMLLYGGVFAYGIHRALIGRKNESYKFILVLLFVPSTVIFGIASFSSSLAFNVRYVLYGLPFYIIFLSATLGHLSTRKRRILVSIVAVLSLWSLSNHYFGDKYAKLDFRSVVEYLHETMRDGDKALIVHEGAKPLLQYYDKTGTLSQYCIPELNSLEIASSIINQSHRIFYVKSIRTQQYDEREIGRIEKLLAQTFDLRGSTNHTSQVKIEIYEREKR